MKTVHHLALELDRLPLDVLARETGFVKRHSTKITPKAFLLALFSTTLQSIASLASLAQTIGLINSGTVSKQAVNERFGPGLLRFLKKTLARMLCHKSQSHKLAAALQLRFSRLLVQDATHVSLPARLAKYFPGSFSATKKTATLKIHTLLNLLNEQFVCFDTTAFTYSDQQAAQNILPLLKKGDLLIRDLGYFVIKVFADIHAKGAFFISRWKYGVKLYDPNTQRLIALESLMKKRHCVDTLTLLGKNEKLPVRIVLLRLPPNVVAQRQRRAKNNRDQRRRPTKHYLSLLNWLILITNTDPTQLSLEQIADVYGLRWRIESVFKSWKSVFSIQDLPNASALRMLCHVYAMLLFITLFHFTAAKFYAWPSHSPQRSLSLLKLARFFQQHFYFILVSSGIIVCPEPQLIKEQIAYSCTYIPRKDRLNYVQKIASLA
ncbi:IS4 family transposase [bacterium]|nr:IS4 family transposase [bacterium]